MVIQFFAIFFLFTFAQCEKDNNTKLGNSEREYKGTATVTVEFWDYDVYSNQDVYVGKKEYTYNVFVFTGPPLRCEGVNETNPFNLSIYPERISGQDEEGHFDMSSCMIINDPYVGKVILQYWNLTLNGQNLSGTLTDNHTAEASASNLIWAMENIAGIQMTMPFPIATGAILTGTINDKNCNFTISGQSTNTYRRFSCNISANI